METYSDCGFEAIKYGIKLPTRSTAFSAGYDIATVEDATLKPGEKRTLHTGIKAHIPPNLYLQLTIRSGMAFKKGLNLVNQVGVIDSDYQEEILLGIVNTSDKVQHIHAGDRLVNGIFLQYFRVPGDNITTERRGGFGSTGE